MKRCTNSFPLRKSFIFLTFLPAVLALAALDIRAQTRPGAGVYQKISFKSEKPCTIEASGDVTALIKNGVELSVTEDWDCDGIPDAYDNCVGMPNPSQVDNDGNGIGDVCEAATLITTGTPVKERSNAKAVDRKVDRRSRKSDRAGHSRREHTKAKKDKHRSSKPAAKTKAKKRR